MQQFQYNLKASQVKAVYLISGVFMALGAGYGFVPTWLQILFFAVYMLLTLFAITKRFSLPLWQGALLAFSTVIILLSTMYYLYAVPKILLIVFTLAPLPWCIRWLSSQQLNLSLLSLANPLVVVTAIAIDIWLLIEVLLSQTTALRPSPWQGLDATFFILFAISSALLIALWQQERKRTQFLLSALHLLVVLAIPTLMYPLGYGFDAFIHRATEDWIATQGVIFPKQPYYVGQYTLVVWLHHLTNISIFTIDVWLVPLFTAVGLPLIALANRSKQTWRSLTTIIGYLALPFLSLHLTTPHNFVLFLALLVALLCLVQTRPLCTLLPAFAAAFIHPLIGIPTLLFAVAYTVYKAYPRQMVWVGLFILQATSMPILFMLNNIRAGAGTPTLSNPISALGSFIDLFSIPYWYNASAPLYLEVLYSYERTIPILLLMFALIGFWVGRKNKQYFIYPATALGLLVSAWLIRSWIIFPDIVDYEQRDFPLRLVNAAGLFIFPLAIIGASYLLKKLYTLRSFQIAFPIGIGALLMISLYLTYPQVNAKVSFPGFNITEADIEAVHAIQNAEKPGSYIVLSNQLTAAAALKEFSFQTYHQTIDGSEHFYYAIPTGGKLYAQYLQFLYEGQERSSIEDAMDYAQVNTAYVLVSDFWKQADTIIQNARQQADDIQYVQEGKITILRYAR